MPHYRVTGYDRQGVCLFEIVVEAPGKNDAQWLATERLRRTADGAALIHRTERIEARPERKK